MSLARIGSLLVLSVVVSGSFLACAQDDSSPAELRKLAVATATFPGATELERRDLPSDAFDNTQIRTTFGSDRPASEALEFYDQTARRDGWEVAPWSGVTNVELGRRWEKKHLVLVFSVPDLSAEARTRLGPQFETIFEVNVFSKDK
jgi:hypothetical protein